MQLDSTWLIPPRARGQRDVKRSVADRLDELRGSPLAQLDDHLGVLVAHVGEHAPEVDPAGMQRASKGDGPADLAGNGGDLVPGRLDGVEDPLGWTLEGSPVLGHSERAYVPVEQGCPKFFLQAGDGGRHRRLDDVAVTGGGGEAARLAAGKEIIQVPDIHEVMVRTSKSISASIRFIILHDCDPR